MQSSTRTLLASVFGGVSVLAVVIAIAADGGTVANDRAIVGVAVLAVDRPEQINANYHTTEDADPRQAESQETKSPESAIDITLQNTGNEGALLTGIDVEVTDSTQLRACQGTGADLVVTAEYKVAVPKDANLPFLSQIPTRNEVPANGFSRFTVTIGPTEKAFQAMPNLYAATLSGRVSGSDSPISIGNVAVASNSFDLTRFRSQAPIDREYDLACFKENADLIERFYNATDNPSPELDELYKSTR